MQGKQSLYNDSPSKKGLFNVACIESGSSCPTVHPFMITYMLAGLIGILAVSGWYLIYRCPRYQDIVSMFVGAQHRRSPAMKRGPTIVSGISITKKQKLGCNDKSNTNTQSQRSND